MTEETDGGQAWHADNNFFIEFTLSSASTSFDETHEVPQIEEDEEMEEMEEKEEKEEKEKEEDEDVAFQRRLSVIKYWVRDSYITCRTD